MTQVDLDAPADGPLTGAPMREDPWHPGPLALLIVALATGILLVAIADYGARLSRGWSDPLFWTGLALLFLPAAFRLSGRKASRSERLWLVIILGLALYAVKVLLEPNAFTLHDELGQYRSVADILRTGRLYVANPVVPAYAYYPGVLSVTAALAKLSGLGIFTSAVIVIGAARVLLLGGLFLLVERVARSSRIAGLAVLVYAANPNFLFFDGQFAYESLAVGLAAMTLWAASRWLEGDTADQEEDTLGWAPEALGLRRAARDWRDLLTAAVLDGALVLTHHLTSYAVAVAIIVWALFEAVRGRSRRPVGRLILLPAFSTAITLAYAIWSWPATQSDIGESITGSINGLISVINGQTAGKHPFTAAAGYSNPVSEKIVGLLSIGLLLAALPVSLYAVWRRRPRTAGLILLAATAILYPATLALRLTSAGSETSNRTSEFVFLGLGTVVGVAFVACQGSRLARRRTLSLSARLLATVCLGLVFIGGITVGNPLYELIPGNFEVAAGNRSVDEEGIDAARWATRLPPGFFLADETDQELFSAYTRLVAQRGAFDGIGIGSVFTRPALGPVEIGVIRYDKLRYLVVDRRDSTALPASGGYFGGADPGGYVNPIPLRSLTKFNHARCIDRVFSSANLTIYDTQPLLNGCR
jgi:hypothetical protein